MYTRRAQKRDSTCQTYQVSLLSRPNISTGVSIDTYFCIKYTIYWYNMVNFCVHKNLLFHYGLLSLCIVMCKIYLVSIAILLVVIVSNIGNEQNIIFINVTINILYVLP
jgi:hypothetical protein